MSQGEKKNAGNDANRPGMERKRDPGQSTTGDSRWNTQQDPEHPERSADGGTHEMRSKHRTGKPQAGTPKPPNQNPNSGGDDRPTRRHES